MNLIKGQLVWKSVVVGLAGVSLVGAGVLAWMHLEPQQNVPVKITQSVPPPPVPQNASPEMKEFLQNQTTLSQKMEQMRSQGTAGKLTLDPQAFVQFRLQNASLLARQSELSQVLAQQQQAKNTVPAPGATVVPANASPQLRTYLQLRDEIMRDQIAFMNQHRTDDLTTRLADMQQWRQQNAPRLLQLQQLMQSLSQVAK